MFSHASVILFTIGLMDTWSLIILVGYSVNPCYGAVGAHPTGMLFCGLCFHGKFPTLFKVTCRKTKDTFWSALASWVVQIVINFLLVISFPLSGNF